MGLVSLRDVGVDPCGPAVQAWVGASPARRLHGCFIGRYAVGGSRPAHVDMAQGYLHTRLVVMLQPAQVGGVLTVQDTPVRLDPLDAVEFRADACAHSVSLIETGERIVLTVGVIEPSG